MKLLLGAPCLLLLAVATSAADDDVRSKPLTLHAPAPAARALKFALLPELQDTTPGNAADHYRRATQNLREEAAPGLEPFEEYGRWLTPPLKDLPLDEMARFLKRCESTFQEVQAGARCEQCAWGLTSEFRQKGFGASQADMLAIRSIGRLLALRCRYELAKGRTQDATRTLRVGFTMSRDVSDAPGLLGAIYGMEISGRMLDVLEEVIQQPDAPSFYWPLTDLPRPLFEMRKQMQGQRVEAYGSFPGLTEMAGDLNAKPWPPEQVQKIVYLFHRYYLYNIAETELEKDKAEAVMLLRIADRHEADVQTLVAEGRPKELVEAMPHVQVALLASMRAYDHYFDEMLQFQSLPLREAQPAMDQILDQAKQMDGQNGSTIPVRWLLPLTSKWLARRAEQDRRIAALRGVEAVRLYAAAHDGKLPASLDDIKDVPMPTDPIDGKPFGYRVVGDHAFFSSSPFPGEPAGNANTPYNAFKANTPTYELIFNR